eukprot:COSAG01_NODE_5333_length_4327_cov_10.804872_3_plen_61_part_01
MLRPKPQDTTIVSHVAMAPTPVDGGDGGDGTTHDAEAARVGALIDDAGDTLGLGRWKTKHI